MLFSNYITLYQIYTNQFAIVMIKYANDYDYYELCDDQYKISTIAKTLKKNDENDYYDNQRYLFFAIYIFQL